MQVAEASVVIPLSPEETWDLVYSDMQQAINSSLTLFLSKTFKYEMMELPGTGWCERQVPSP